MKAQSTRKARRSAPPRSVDAYLAGLPCDARVALQELRRVIAAAAPGSVETIRYRIPIVEYEGQMLVGFAAFRKHCSFYVMCDKVMRAHARLLRPYDTGIGTIRFEPSQPLPVGLVRTLVKARIARNRARVAERQDARR